MTVTVKETVQLDRRDPFVAWESIDVQFPETPHTDLVIPHSLDVEAPRDVHYRVIKQYTAGSIYEPVVATSKEWTHDYIVLRSDTSNWTGRLLLGTVTQIGPFITEDFDIPEGVTGGAPVTTLTGDVTGSGEGTVPTQLTDHVVSLSKLVNLSGPCVIGKDSGTGTAQAVVIGEGLQLNGAGLSIADASVPLNKLTVMAGGRLLGRRVNIDGTPEAILLGNSLSMAGNTLYFNNNIQGSVVISPNGFDPGSITAPGGASLSGTDGLRTTQVDILRTTFTNGGMAMRGTRNETIDGVTDFTFLSGGSATMFAFNINVSSAINTPVLRSMVMPTTSMTPGLLRVIHNSSISNFTITHNGAAAPGNRFWCPNQRDYVVKPSERVFLIHTGGAYWYFVGSSRADMVTTDLNDAADGTWTPTVTFGGGSTGMTFSLQSGLYKRRGNLVFASGTLRFTAKGSSTGNAVIGGLPFTCVAAPDHGSVTVGYYDQFTSVAGGVSGYVSGGTTTIIPQTNGTSSVTQLTDANFQNGTGLVFVAIYFI